MTDNQNQIVQALRDRDAARSEIARLRYGSDEAAREAFLRERLIAAERERDRARQQVLMHIRDESGDEEMRRVAAERGWEYLLSGGAE
mgnify:CR=1 FL=1